MNGAALAASTGRAGAPSWHCPAMPGAGCSVAVSATAIPAAREVRGNGRKALLEVFHHGRE